MALVLALLLLAGAPLLLVFFAISPTLHAPSSLPPAHPPLAGGHPALHECFIRVLLQPCPWR